MSTLGEMITDIQTDIGRTDLSATNGPIHNKILAAISDLQPKRFFFNEDDTQTFPTVANQVRYGDDDVPDAPDWTDWYQLDQVFLEESSGQRHTLLPMDFEELKLLTDTPSGSSRPVRYARRNDAMYLYPKPDAVYTIRLSGHYKVEPPESSGEANNKWMTKAYYAVKHLAKAKLYAQLIRNFDMAKAEMMEHANQLDLLYVATTNKKATGKIQPTQF